MEITIENPFDPSMSMTISHKMTMEAKCMVINAFLKAPRSIFPYGIRLHIDDGLLGGGGSVDFVEILAIEDKPGDFDDLNDFYDHYFSSDRKRIFRYCVFAHKIDTGRSGRRSGPDRFVIADAHEVVNPDAKGHIYGQAGTFMHELGHMLKGMEYGHGGMIGKVSLQGRIY